MALLAYALCAVSDVEKQYNGGTSYDSNETAVVENMINLATKYAENYIGRYIKGRGEDLAESIDVPMKTQELFVTNFPVISITSVVEDGDTLTEGEDEDYIYYDEDGCFLRNDVYWTSGYKKVVITYQGGYATVPEDLKQWCIDVAGFMYEARTDGNVASERVGEISVSYGKSSGIEAVGNIVSQKSYLKDVLDFYKGNVI